MAVKVYCCVEQSANKKSIFRLRMRSEMLYLLFVLSFLAGVSALDTELSCSNVKSKFVKKGLLPASFIQDQPTSDVGQLCSNKGCCRDDSRQQLVKKASEQLDSMLKSELGKLATTFESKAQQFDSYFEKLLEKSHEDFHGMFKRTYGMIYEQHSYVFSELFDRLKKFYEHGDEDFDKMMDGFFSILNKKMFTVLNSQYHFDAAYLKCVNEHMREVQPFEDVPSKLSVQLRRAFVAARAFHKALQAGAEVLRTMIKVGVSETCVTSWARLRYCGACGGQQPACSRYCHNVAKGCFPLHADISDHWKGYIDALEKVADRLLGPFNIAMVVRPIDIKVSEAIMSYQEHNQQISQKIFSSCGKPDLDGSAATGTFFAAPERSKRSIRSIPDFDWSQKRNDVDDFEIEASFESVVDDPTFLSFRNPEAIKKATEQMAEQAKLRQRFLEYIKGNINLAEYEEHERRKRDAEPEAGSSDVDFGMSGEDYDDKSGSKKKSSGKGYGREWGGPNLDRIVRETRTRVKAAQRYFASLPALFCAHHSVTTTPCFNGTDSAVYLLPAAGEGSTALASNPEVSGSSDLVDKSRSERAAIQLREHAATLRDAFNGQPVRWAADRSEPDALHRADEQAASSTDDFVDSAGSGSGSGDTETGEDYYAGLPDDDEDSLTDNEGSGDHETSRTEYEDKVITTYKETVTPDMTTEPDIYEDPKVINPPNTNNVHIRGRTGLPESSDVEPPVKTETVDDGGQTTPVKEHPASTAERPSLHKALFTYALPVVCAWFGTIVTDLF